MGWTEANAAWPFSLGIVDRSTSDVETKKRPGHVELAVRVALISGSAG